MAQNQNMDEKTPFQIWFWLTKSYLKLSLWKKIVTTSAGIYLLALFFLPFIEISDFGSISYSAAVSSGGRVSLWFSLAALGALIAGIFPFIRMKIPFGEPAWYFVLGILLAIWPILRIALDGDLDFGDMGLGVWVRLASGAAIAIGAGVLGGGYASIKDQVQEVMPERKEKTKKDKQEESQNGEEENA